MNDYLNQLLKVPVSVALFATLTLPLAAQTQLTAPNPQSTAPNSGLFPGGGYSVNNIESINGVTGTMALNIPIAHLPPGPAGDSTGVNLVYNSTLFDMATGPAFIWIGQTDYLASYEWAYYQPSAHGGGWTYGYQYQLWSQWASNVAASYACPSGVTTNSQWFKTYLTTPDGGNHLLLLESSVYSNGSAGPAFTNNGTNYPQEYYGVDFSGNLNHFCATGSSRFQGTLNYVTIDGSYIRVQTNTSTMSWQAFFPDGSVVDGRTVTDGSGEATTSDGFAISDRNVIT